MNNSSRRPLTIAIAAVVLIVVLAGGYWGLRTYDNHQRAKLRDSLARGYATQALTAPFTLTTKWWLSDLQPFASTGQWDYTYAANLSEPDTLAAAKAQFSRGAYQVDANHPDVITAHNATLYRDLITEDVALKIIIGNTSGPFRTTAPTDVMVILSPLSGP